MEAHSYSIPDKPGLQAGHRMNRLKEKLKNYLLLLTPEAF
jgi:hypothetical protein